MELNHWLIRSVLRKYEFITLPLFAGQALSSLSSTVWTGLSLDSKPHRWGGHCLTAAPHRWLVSQLQPRIRSMAVPTTTRAQVCSIKAATSHSTPTLRKFGKSFVFCACSLSPAPLPAPVHPSASSDGVCSSSSGVQWVLIWILFQ